MRKEVAHLKILMDRTLNLLNRVDDVETLIAILPRIVRVMNILHETLDYLQSLGSVT